MPQPVEPVFDPELPPEVRKAYDGEPDRFTPASRPMPAKRSELRRELGVSVGGAVMVAVMLVGLWFLLRWLYGLLLPDTPAAVLTVVTGVFGGLCFGSMVMVMFEESDTSKLAREHHGKYLLPEDFDDEATPVVLRAQQAVRTVRTAEVTKRGLLDDIRHEVVLPEQLWDLGLLLQRQSALRTRQRELIGETELPALEPVLRPQREALRKSEEAATRKTEALERLAQRVTTADAALRAQELMPTVLGDSDKYLELLATLEPAGDTKLIDELGEDASIVTEVLNRTIEDIRTTSRELTEG